MPIIKHEDVRRMLLDLKAHLEAMRALIFQTYYYFDVVENTQDAEEKKYIQSLIEVIPLLLRPTVLIKPGNSAQKPCRYMAAMVTRKNIRIC